MGKESRRKSLQTGMENSIMWGKKVGGKTYTQVWKTVSRGQRPQAEKLTHRYGKQYHMGRTAGEKPYTQVWKTVSHGKDDRRKSLHIGMENNITWEGRRKSLHTGMENSIM